MARVGAPVLITAAALGVRELLEPELGASSPFLVFNIAVLVSAYVGGLQAGLVSTLLGTVLGLTFYMHGSLASSLADSADRIRVIVFVINGVLTSLLCATLLAARFRASINLEAAESANMRAAAIRETALDAVITMDHRGRIVEFNKAAETMFLRRREDVVGAELAATIIPERLRVEHRRGIARFLETGRAKLLGRRVEMPAMRGDGSEFPVDVSVTAAVIDQDKPFFTAYVRDLTSAKQAQAALAAKEDRFRQMADAAPVLVWVADREGRRTWFNKSWLDFVGRPITLEVGNGWRDSIHPEDREQFFAAYRAAAASHEPFSNEHRLRRADGTYRWILNRCVPLTDPDLAFHGYVCSCIEIEDLKRAEQERLMLIEREREAREAAVRADRLKDEFLTTLSHELRTPLNAMLGWVQVLRRGGTSATDTAKALGIIERNVWLQSRLIEELLDMNRIVSGRMKLDVQPTELRAVVEAALETVQPSAEARQVRIVTSLAEHATKIAGDPVRLQQVCWNLLSNAIKFTPKGGTVRVALRDLRSHMEIEVSDTGVGIEAEFQPHIFERFSQAVGSGRQGGLGLGLAIVKNLVEMHGGTVACYSAGANQGAKFTVTLPVGTAPRRSAQPTEHENGRSRASRPPKLPEIQGVRVLVVDDERDARELVQHVLAQEGAIVATAESAPDALSQLPEFAPDLLISDIGMPQMDGFELIRSVRALPAPRGGEVPAIALTAFATSTHRSQALMAGFQMHVAKPVDTDELLAAVASLARGKHRPSKSK